MDVTKDIFHDPTYRFHPALALDDALSPKTRSAIMTASGVFWLCSVFLSFFFAFREIWMQVFMSPTLVVPTYLSALATEGGAGGFFGTFCVFFSIWLAMWMLTWFKNSYYYHVEALLERGQTGSKTPYTTPNYETNEIFFSTKEGDLTGSFLSSKHGREISRRAGLEDSEIQGYLSQRTVAPDFRTYASIGQVFTLRDIAKAVISFDQDFAKYVFAKGIRPEDIEAASEWVERMLKRARRRSRVWGRVSLGRSRGIGSDLSYGVAYTLQRYSIDMTHGVSVGTMEFRHIYGSDTIGKMESILSRTDGGNVILVGAERGSLMDVIVDFTHDLVNGFTHSRFASAHVMSLDWKRLMSGMRTKQELESRIQKMFDGAVRARNIILVIDDLPGFMSSAQSIGTDLVAVIEPYAHAGGLHFIATAELGSYHAHLEQNGSVRAQFETLIIPEPEKSSLTRTLEDAATRLEPLYGILFTYPAVRAVREGAQRYFVDPIMPDTALKLMEELAPAVRARGDLTVGHEDVMNYIQAKTKIPVGTITDAERERLRNLENDLRLRVIGQEKALEVIANALRRSRAGVRNPNRPIGTFLFLGPTGVGKTEVAKALAEVFFGDATSMIRLDMSEFQSEDGVARLIGGASYRQGVLSNSLREHPYTVLLLDEFEKTHPKVLDLFLQIFDEGIYHDGNGKKVNAQNTIMIATSNAGAVHIRNAVEQGVPLDSVEKQIVDGVIAEGKYKPELLNRFDAVVLFHPLTRDDYRKVATLMVEKLRKRLREQNIDIAVNDVLIEALLARGVDPEFGARPMNRAVQELVEQAIAKKIIDGEVVPGMTVTFKKEDFPGILA